MKLEGLHLLLTYQCTFECDHCFVWGSPWQSGTMTLDFIRKILNQAKDTNSIEWIYFEGGEPFLYYQLMLAGIDEAINNGFKIGIVTNSYWATSEEDAHLWLSPLAGKVQDLTISSDLFHFPEKVSQQSRYVQIAAEKLQIPFGVICIEQLEVDSISSRGKLPQESTSIMFRGRAAEKLTHDIPFIAIENFNECPHENLIEPGRIHVDPFGNLHICQGISMGNINNSPISELCEAYHPNNHPIIGPLFAGGPYNLSTYYKLNVAEKYADACHLCYAARIKLRSKFPEILLPDQMYGVTS